MYKVSVIIPCYNCSSTIKETISSVLDQTFTNFEIIVVDDGSTDRSLDILEEFGDQIQLIRQKNSGAALARNTGIEHARGNLVAFLDADDTWLPDKLKLQVDKIDEGYDMVHCPAVNVGDLGIWNPPVTQTVKTAPQDYLESLFLENMIVTSSVLVKTQCIKKAGGFDPAFRSCEDWDLWIRLSAHCRITCLDSPLVKYRIASESLSSSVEAILSSGLAVIEKNRDLLLGHRQRKILRTAVQEMYLNACWRYLRAGKKNKAVSCALRAISTDPLKFSAWVWLARTVRYSVIPK